MNDFVGLVSSTFSNIPPEIFVQISIYLELSDLIKLLLLSRQSHAVIIPILWREIDLGRFSKSLNLPNHTRSTRSQNASSKLKNLIHTQKLIWDWKEVDRNHDAIKKAIKLLNHEVTTLEQVLSLAPNLRNMQLGIHQWIVLDIIEQSTLTVARKTDHIMQALIRLLHQSGTFNISLTFGHPISRAAKHYLNTLLFKFPKRIISLAIQASVEDTETYIEQCPNLENVEFRNSSGKDWSSLMIRNKTVKSMICHFCWVQPVSWLKQLSINSIQDLSPLQWEQIFELNKLEYLEISIDGRNQDTATLAISSSSVMTRLKHFSFTYHSNEHNPPSGLFKAIALAGPGINHLKIYSRISDEEFQEFLEKCRNLHTVYFRPQHAETFTTQGMLYLSRAKRLRVIHLDYSCPPLTLNVIRNIIFGCPALMDVSVHVFSLNFKAIRAQGWEWLLKPSSESPLFYQIQVQSLRREILRKRYTKA